MRRVLVIGIVLFLEGGGCQPSAPSSPSPSGDSSVGLSQTAFSTTPSSSSLLGAGSDSALLPSDRSTKIFFRLQTPSQPGSFSSSSFPTSAVHTFHPDETPQATFPPWLESVTLVPSPTQSGCFQFGTLGYLELAESQCRSSVPLSADAGPQITLQVVRSQLGASENLLLSLDFFATTSQASLPAPTLCFQAGVFRPEACSEWTLKLRLSGDPSPPLLDPFAWILPPFPSGLPTAGFSLMTQQLFIPLAADPGIQILSFVHTQGSLTPTCQSASPFCSGAIFYALSIYRI